MKKAFAEPKSAIAEMEKAFAEPIPAIAEMEEVFAEPVSATSKMKSATSKMILEDGFGAKNGKKPGFLRAAGRGLCANSNGTG